MGDDTTIIVPPVEEEENLDETGLALVRLLESSQTRIDELVATIGELNGRITVLEAAIANHRHDYAEVGHSHDGFADAGHSHDGYALSEHAHAPTTEERKPDKRPENQHPYFRKVGE